MSKILTLQVSPREAEWFLTVLREHLLNSFMGSWTFEDIKDIDDMDPDFIDLEADEVRRVQDLIHRLREAQKC